MQEAQDDTYMQLFVSIFAKSTASAELYAEVIYSAAVWWSAA